MHLNVIQEGNKTSEILTTKQFIFEIQTKSWQQNYLQWKSRYDPCGSHYVFFTPFKDVLTWRWFTGKKKKDYLSNLTIYLWIQIKHAKAETSIYHTCLHHQHNQWCHHTFCWLEYISLCHIGVHQDYKSHTGSCKFSCPHKMLPENIDIVHYKTIP